MSRVHYFQRYHQKENLVTNNTLLLLSRLYSTSPDRFAGVMAELIEDENLAFGTSFSQQERGPRSVIDGAIVQEPARIMIETKLSKGGFDKGQIERHLTGIADQAYAVLLLLAPEVVAPDELVRLCGEASVVVKSTSFEELTRLVKEVIHDFEPELMRMVEDYEAFCQESGLIDNAWRRMRVVPCSASIDHNREYGVYYQPAARGYSSHAFIGLYTGKEVRAVGKVIDVVCPTIDLETNAVTRSDGKAVSSSARDTLLAVARTAAKINGWDLRRDHRFFFVDAFVPTTFRKASKHGMMNSRFFDLKEYLPNPTRDSTAAEVAQALNDSTW